MLTSAAIPSVIEIENKRSRRRLERLSRHAIFQMKEEVITPKEARNVLVWGAHAPSRVGCGASPQRTSPRTLRLLPNAEGLGKSSRRRGAFASTRGRVRSP